MPLETIRKRPEDCAGANLQDYEATCCSFTWDDARRLLDGLPGGGLNIAFEAVDRHVLHGHGKRLALRWLGRDGGVRDFTYADLKGATDRFANVLARLGVSKGDRVFCLLGRIPELYVAALGTVKRGAVFSPAVLGLRAGAGTRSPHHRRGPRAGHLDPPLSPQGGGVAA